MSIPSVRRRFRLQRPATATLALLRPTASIHSTALAVLQL
jgi:hypothetical protein